MEEEMIIFRNLRMNPASHTYMYISRTAHGRFSAPYLAREELRTRVPISERSGKRERCEKKRKERIPDLYPPLEPAIDVQYIDEGKPVIFRTEPAFIFSCRIFSPCERAHARGMDRSEGRKGIVDGGSILLCFENR